MSKVKQIIFEDENPEWTEADFARARPLSEFPALAKALSNARGRPKMAALEVKRQVTLRLSPRVLDHFRSTGAGWQARINATLEATIPK